MNYETVYIYALVDPQDNRIRYIGKSIDPEARFEQHINSKDTNKRKIAWINSLKLKGMLPNIVVLEHANEKNWQKRERWWIKRGREFGWKLLNLTDGGEGSIYQLPSSLYWLLDKRTLDKLEKLPSKKQADIVLEVAEELADGFVEMVKYFIAGEHDKYLKCQENGRRITVNMITRALGREF